MDTRSTPRAVRARQGLSSGSSDDQSETKRPSGGEVVALGGPERALKQQPPTKEPYASRLAGREDEPLTD